MIGVGHIIAFFVGAFVGRFLEDIVEMFRKTRDDIDKIREGK